MSATSMMLKRTLGLVTTIQTFKQFLSLQWERKGVKVDIYSFMQLTIIEIESFLRCKKTVNVTLCVCNLWSFCCVDFHLVREWELEVHAPFCRRYRKVYHGVCFSNGQAEWINICFKSLHLMCKVQTVGYTAKFLFHQPLRCSVTTW